MLIRSENDLKCMRKCIFIFIYILLTFILLFLERSIYYKNHALC